MRLRVDLEENHVQRSCDALRRRHSFLRQTFCDVAHEHTMQVVFEMRIFETTSDRERIPDATLRDDLQKLIHLCIVLFRLELQCRTHRLMLRPDDCFMQYGRW